MLFPFGDDWPRYEMGLVIPTMPESLTAHAGSEENLYINTALSTAFANVLHRRPPVRVLDGRVYLDRVRTHFLFHLRHKYGGGGTLTGEYNAGSSFNMDRNKWGCATSRAFREVACRTADTHIFHQLLQCTVLETNFDPASPAGHAVRSAPAFFSSHFSCTVITDSQPQPCENSSRVQHREVCPSRKTDLEAVSRQALVAL